MNPLVTSSPSFIGPLLSDQSDIRKKNPHRLNETSSLKDGVFDETVPASIGLPNPNQLIDFYANSMQLHVEKRVAIFFQQLVACYQTKLHFEIGTTLDQGESAPALKYETPDGISHKLCTRNAAHSSTIPCLVAYKESEWKDFIDNKIDAAAGFIYFKGSHLYGLCNSTIDMPRAINEADIAIDGKSNDSALRKASLELLNKASQGQVSPMDGLKDFLKILTTMVDDKKHTAPKDDVKRALRHYARILKNINESINDDQEIFNQWLDIRLDPTDESAEVRKAIYHIRYKAIQTNLEAQAKVIDKIDRVKNTIFSAMKKEKTKYCFSEDAFKHSLINLANDDDAIRLRKLFNLPAENDTIAAYVKSKNRILLESKQIKILLGEISKEFARMKSAEIGERSSLTKKLRKAKNWTQKNLSNEIAKLYPNLPSSQSTISRVETRAKIIDEFYAEKLSKVFKVDAGLFMPTFFNTI